MQPFDYGAAAELVPTAGETEVFPTRSRRKRQPTGYGRFARAADAIRFAVEELPPKLLLGPLCKSLGRDSAATQYAGCTKAPNTRWPDAVRAGERMRSSRMIFTPEETPNEVPSAPRSCRDQTHRSRGENRLRHHHPRHCQGETAVGRDHRHRAWRPR